VPHTFWALPFLVIYFPFGGSGVTRSYEPGALRPGARLSVFFLTLLLAPSSPVTDVLS
jgi:hypothetical protein